MYVKGNDLSGYLGVDPVYQNYANETDKPLTATEGDSVAVVEEFKAFEKSLKPIVVTDNKDEDKEKEDNKDKNDKTEVKDERSDSKGKKLMNEDDNPSKLTFKKKN